jgi:hypothetical protein
MRIVQHARWTILPKTAPEPWIACSGCGGPRPFQSSGKIRLNAQGKKLDAWLIYKCRDCDKTWNCPIFERRSVDQISAADLEALHANDPAWVRRREFDIAGLRGKVWRIDEYTEFEVHKEVLCDPDGGPRRKEITLIVPLPSSLRLDRLLSRELELSRSVLQGLHKRGKLLIDPDLKDGLHRRIKDGTHVILEKD